MLNVLAFNVSPGGRYICFCGRSELLCSQTPGIERSKPGSIPVSTAHEPPRLEPNDSAARPGHRPFKDPFVNAK